MTARYVPSALAGGIHGVARERKELKAYSAGKKIAESKGDVGIISDTLHTLGLIDKPKGGSW